MKLVQVGVLLFSLMANTSFASPGEVSKSPVDFVNPYMGNISHLLVPTYPTIHLPNSMLRVYPERGDYTGDSRRMNSNHAVATVADAYTKGLRGFDLDKAYLICKKGIEEKTLIPWSGAPAGWLDDFYKKNGYIPALQPGEKETVPNVPPSAENPKGL